jgi:peptidoglycan/xylan/chitin deacetylase (PgdA/CDA1 family)
VSAAEFAKSLLGWTFGSEAAFRITDGMLNRPKMPYVRAINYHDTPQEFAPNFRRQLQWLSSRFENCDLRQLRKLLSDGEWAGSKPGVLISFDDGLKSQYDTAAPILEEFGFTGWFMLPVAFLDAADVNHADFAVTNNISCQTRSNSDDLAMSWDEARDLERRGHVITCHSMNHKRLSDSLTDSALREEIVDSKTALESRLGHPVSGFTWVGGEEPAYCKRAFDLMLEAGYSEIFCTNCEPIVARNDPRFLDRSNVEAHFGLGRVRLVLGGLYDRKYDAKRRRVFNLLTESKSDARKAH